MAGRREIIGEAVVQLSAIDRNLKATLESAKIATAKTMAEIDAMGVDIEVDVRLKDHKAKIAAAKTELEGLKQAYEDLGSSRTWSAEGKGMLAHMTMLDELIQKTTRDLHELTLAVAAEAAAEKALGQAKAKTWAEGLRMMDRMTDRELVDERRQKAVAEDKKRREDEHLQQIADRRAMQEAATLAEASAAKKLEAVLEGIGKRRANKIREDVEAAGGARKYLDNLGEEKRLLNEINRIRGEMGLAQIKSKDANSGWWSRVTHSKDFRQTLTKIGKEPVRLGPFSATLKGLTVGATALGPIIASVAGSVGALTAAIGGALTSALTIGAGALFGFGQAALGVGMIVGPYVKQFQLASQVTNSYATAVAKYGKDSKQASKAQEQMNNVLKGMSPTAQAAYKDLSIVQTEFAKMTKKATPALDNMLRSTMSTFRTLGPSFAKNSVGAVNSLSSGWGVFMRGLRQDAQLDPKGGFLNTTFKNANAALRPLVVGLGSLFIGIGRVGAAASRHLKPLADKFRNWAGGLALKSSDSRSLNGGIDSLKRDFDSVGRSVLSAGRWLKDFFNLGRGAGRGLFDSLTKTFDRWDRFAKSKAGKEEIKSFFEQAAEGGRRLGDVLAMLGQGFSLFTRTVAPLATLLSNLVIKPMTSFLRAVMQSSVAVRGLQVALLVLAGVAIGNKIGRIALDFIRLKTAIVGAKMAMMAMPNGKFMTRSMVGAAEFGAINAMPMAGMLGTRVKQVESAGQAALHTQVSRGLYSLDNVATTAAGAKLGGMAANGEKAASKFGLLTGSVSRLGTAFALMTSPLGATTIAVGLVAAAMLTAKRGTDDLYSAAEKIDGKFKNLNPTMSTALISYQQYRDAVSAAADAERAFAADQSESNKIALNAAQGQKYVAYENYKKSMVEFQKTQGDVLKQASDTVTQAQADYSNAMASGDSNWHLEQLRLAADKAAESYKKLQNNAKAFVDFSKMRVDAGLANFDSINPDMVYNNLARIREMVNNDKITAKIATTVQTPEDMGRVARDVQSLINQKVPPAKIAAIITANSDSAESIIAALEAHIKRPKTKPVKTSTRTDSEFDKLGDPISKTINVTARAVGKAATGLWHELFGAEGGMFAEGGVVAAASGYTKQTAALNANGRQTRRAMGAFREPTFLVGEENRTEYVIATNPAYRAQNRRYLASAAHELGMQVVPAAAGHIPYSSRLMADAFLDSKQINAQIKKDKQRLSKLNRSIAHYNRLPHHSANARVTHAEQIRERDQLKHDLKVGAKSTSIIKGDAAAIAYQQSLVDRFTAEMTLAEKLGDSARYERARQGKIAALQSLDKKYSIAEQGQSGSRLSKLLAAQYGIETDLNDTKNASIGGFAGQLAQGQIEQQNALIKSLQNENVINSMFVSTRDGLDDLIASGGPRMSLKGGSGLAEGGVNININTLTAHDPRHEELIRNTVVGALSNQGGVQASSMSVG